MLVVENSGNLYLVDDFYFSDLFDDEEVVPISIEKYALELHLQEALMSSTISSRVPTESTYLQMYKHLLSGKARKGKEKQIGESSNSKTDHGRQIMSYLHGYQTKYV
ncbi:hypothetical protein REPUB_Repub14bG0081000 [Reevesia pubescens]